MRKSSTKKTSRKFDTTIAIRLPVGVKDKIMQIAKSKGLSASSLARMRLFEKHQSVKKKFV